MMTEAKERIDKTGMSSGGGSIGVPHFSTPNHTIPMEAVREGMSLRSRRYRNRRLGEFLKELDLIEGRATGIPTIQNKLKANSSSKATIETDEEKTYFQIDIPCHPEFLEETLLVDTNVTKQLTEKQFTIWIILILRNPLTISPTSSSAMLPRTTSSTSTSGFPRGRSPW